jgi:transposase
VNGFSHCYKRHGTTTLFAALEISTGQVKTAHDPRRRRREFLDFMNEIVAAHPHREIHVALDNLNTHKPKDDRRLKRHPKVHLHFTPTYSSWLNQVERWFSILSRQALRGASFTSPQQLRQAIDDFVASYNQNAAPFEWKKSIVFPSALKSKYFFKLHIHEKKSASDLLEKPGKNMEARSRNEPEPDCSYLTTLCMKCRCRCLLKFQQDFSCRRQEDLARTGDFNSPL